MTQPLFIITGAMAAGKSTIAKALVQRFEKSAHVGGDAFLRMIGKGGALSVSECLALGVPIILYGSPPGNELGNARHMEAIGAGRIADTVDDVVRYARWAAQLG